MMLMILNHGLKMREVGGNKASRIRITNLASYVQNKFQQNS